MQNSTREKLCVELRNRPFVLVESISQKKKKKKKKMEKDNCSEKAVVVQQLKKTLLQNYRK